MLTVSNLTGFGSGSLAPSYVALASGANTANQTSYTFTSVDFGTASQDRVLLVYYCATTDGVAQIVRPSVTIGGITATPAQNGGYVRDLDVYDNKPSGFFYANVPTGTSGNIVISFAAGTATECAYALYGLYNVTTPPRLSGTHLTVTDFPTLSLDANEIAIFGIYATTYGTWTGATESLVSASRFSTAVYQGSGSLSVSNTYSEPDLSATRRVYVVFGGADSRARRRIQFVGGHLHGDGAGTTEITQSLSTIDLWHGTDHELEVNDLIIALYAAGSSGTDLALTIKSNAGTDYTLIESELYASSGAALETNLRVAYKFYNGTDTSIVWGTLPSSSNERVIGWLVFRGVDTSTPLDVAATTATGTTNWNVDPPSITPTTAGAYIVCIGACADALVDYQFNGDLHGVRSGILNTTYDVSAGYGLKPDWTSGAFDAAQLRPTVADGTWCAMSIALRPAS